MTDNSGYIYIIHIREFLLSNIPVYKIGKTKQNGFKRYQSYPKGSKLIIHLFSHDCDQCEKSILSSFTTKFSLRQEYGSEYFFGDVAEMVSDVIRINLLFKANEKQQNESLNHDEKDERTSDDIMIGFFTDKIVCTSNKLDRLGKGELYIMYNEYCEDVKALKKVILGRNFFYKWIEEKKKLKTYRDRDFTGLRVQKNNSSV